jgi:choline dehydrogenase
MNSQDIATTVAASFSERVRNNQQILRSALRDEYDFIACGSCSSGSVVARRLAENAAVSVLPLEAGSTDDLPEVMMANQWPMNLGSEREWNFHAEPTLHVNGRSVTGSTYAMQLDSTALGDCHLW